MQKCFSAVCEKKCEKHLKEVLQPQSKSPCSLCRRALCRRFWCNLWRESDQTRPDEHTATCLEPNLDNWICLDRGCSLWRAPAATGLPWRIAVMDKIFAESCESMRKEWQNSVLDHSPYSLSPCTSLVSHHPTLLCNKLSQFSPNLFDHDGNRLKISLSWAMSFSVFLWREIH